MIVYIAIYRILLLMIVLIDILCNIFGANRTSGGVGKSRLNQMFVSSYVCSDRNSSVSGRGYKYDERLTMCVRYLRRPSREGVAHLYHKCYFIIKFSLVFCISLSSSYSIYNIYSPFTTITYV